MPVEFRAGLLTPYGTEVYGESQSRVVSLLSIQAIARYRKVTT